MMRPIPAQTYKALLWDYEYLLAQSEDECSYCLSNREVQIILTMLDYISWKTRYIQQKDDIDQTTINHWQANLGRKLMSGCCGEDGKIYRYTEDGTLESSTDGGITWTPDPDSDPRLSAPIAPPLPGVESDAKRCAAADNIRDQYKAMRDQTIALLTAGTTVLAIVAGLVAIIAFILSISVVATSFGVILFGLSAALLSMTPEEVEEQINDVALDLFRCIVYCQLDQNGRVVVGGFDNILSEIASQFDGFPETFFYSITASLQANGLNNAATLGVSTASDCTGCDDCPTYCPQRYEALIVSGTPKAFDIVYGSDWIEFTAADTFGYIAAPVLGECCYVGEIELISGTGSATAWCECGQEYPNLIHTTPFGHCCQVIEVIGSMNARYRIHLADCG